MSCLKCLEVFVFFFSNVKEDKGSHIECYVAHFVHRFFFLGQWMSIGNVNKLSNVGNVVIYNGHLVFWPYLTIRKWKHSVPFTSRKEWSIPEIMDEKEMDKKFFKLAKEENWQKCPKCTMFVQSSGGCEHITCRFCYLSMVVFVAFDLHTI